MAQHSTAIGGPRLLIVGGGFAGVWAAASAARLRAEHPGAQLRIALVSPGDDLVIRPRLYQERPGEHRAPLEAILGPIGVERLSATVTAIDTEAGTAAVSERSGRQRAIGFDRLVVASGSQIARPALPGADLLLDIDTMAAAERLDGHLRGLPSRPRPADTDADADGRYAAVVIGAGFTGIEVATELAGRLGAIAGPGGAARVVLVEREPQVGPELGPGPRPVILGALRELGIEVRVAATLLAVTAGGAVLTDGFVPAATVIWTAGMHASPLTAQIPGERDSLGRLVVDRHLRAPGAPTVFAAGDTSAAAAEGGRIVMQSCQHAMPLGRFAGHNAAADLLGAPPAPFDPAPYVTCLDLGPAGAVLTGGWDRQVRETGERAKAIKARINEAIVPPLNDAAALLALAGPIGGTLRR